MVLRTAHPRQAGATGKLVRHQNLAVLRILASPRPCHSPAHYSSSREVPSAQYHHANAFLHSIFVAVPKIAQDKINKAKLTVHSIQVTNTTPTTYTLGFNTSITTDGTVKADIDAFDGVMYLEDEPSHTPFVNIRFPKTNANKFQWVNFTNEITIKDMAAFTKFNTWFVNNETIRVTVEGKTKVQPKGLNRKSSVTFKKTITSKGLNLFKGTQVKNGKADLESQPPKKNFFADVELPNASYFTIDIGNATFANMFDGSSVGDLFINNLYLKPGANTFPVTGSLDQSKVLAAVAKEGTKPVPFHLKGKSVKKDGKDLKYFADALANADQVVELDVNEIIKNSVPSS